MTTPVTTDNFTALVESRDILIIDFWASWCGPCRSFKPIFEAAAAAHTDITFGSCDTEAEAALASALGIRSIPTVMAFREGVLLYSQPGMLPAQGLEDLIAQIRALDMEAVHREVASRAEKEAVAG